MNKLTLFGEPEGDGPTDWEEELEGFLGVASGFPDMEVLVCRAGIPFRTWIYAVVAERKKTSEAGDDGGERDY